MAYFANGSDAEYYENKYCQRCVHWDDDAGCPVYMLHELWNYDQHLERREGTEKKMALDILWPREKDGSNGDCKMFIKKD